MDLDLKRKVFIITGGAKGIGEAITRLLASEGAIPIIIDRDKESGEKLSENLKNQGLECRFIDLDIWSPENCKIAIERSYDLFNQVDGLINNVGVNDCIGLEKGNPKSYRRSLAKNLFHFYDMTHYCIPHLKKSRGVIINISSKTAVTGQGGTSGYTSAKGGVLSLTREWAVELLKYGIRVNAIVPAEVMTPLYESWLSTFDNPKEKLKEITDLIPLGNRMTAPDEIANVVVFLLSNRASHITGQHIYADGGYVHLDRALAVLN